MSRFAAPIPVVVPRPGRVMVRPARHPRCAAVHRALLDVDAVARRRVPDGVSAQMHGFDTRQGGSCRVSLAGLARLVDGGEHLR